MKIEINDDNGTATVTVSDGQQTITFTIAPTAAPATAPSSDNPAIILARRQQTKA